ncbi:MAG: glycoside hydrolase family 88 protein, partial [Kiritimatiellae bacterium]|nr:glycoside hydrolase family 88 protein [Kiritimatiellia bacterium]
ASEPPAPPAAAPSASSEGARFAAARFPRSYADGAYAMREWDDWTNGHWAGALWLLYEATGDAFFRERAEAWTALLAPCAKIDYHHDTGFIAFCSMGQARRILRTDRYDALLLETAASLAKRFHPGLGLIRSWGKIEDTARFLVIPDNMMNLELLEWASKAPGGDRRFDEIARSHADVTMRNHFRPDGSTYHVLDYEQATGRVKSIERGQGASCHTAWSRGQAWGVYGYTMMFRETGDRRYLDFAQKLALHAINHPNMPEDGVPYWDFGAPGEERDSSAGAILASALVELSVLAAGGDEGKTFRAFAEKTLASLASPAYFSQGAEAGHFLLKHGTGGKPMGTEIDVPLVYGDYYFLEALLRLRKIN